MVGWVRSEKVVLRFAEDILINSSRRVGNPPTQAEHVLADRAAISSI